MIWHRAGAGHFCPGFAGAFYTAGKCGTKKGGVDEWGKLRSAAKRNGAILTFLISGGPGLRQNKIANIHRVAKVAPVCGGGGECFPSPMGVAHTAAGGSCSGWGPGFLRRFAVWL